MLVAFGSTTERIIDAAIAASTAFPPFFKIFKASSVAKGCDVAAIPFEQTASFSFVDL